MNRPADSLERPEIPWRCPYCINRGIRPCPHNAETWRQEVGVEPQPPAAPVAWRWDHPSLRSFVTLDDGKATGGWKITPLYATPTPAAVPDAVRGLDAITAEWVIGYLPATAKARGSTWQEGYNDAVRLCREEIAHAFAEWAALSAAPEARDDDGSHDAAVWALIDLAQECGAKKDEDDNSMWWTLDIHAFYALEAKLYDRNVPWQFVGAAQQDGQP